MKNQGILLNQAHAVAPRISWVWSERLYLGCRPEGVGMAVGLAADIAFAGLPLGPGTALDAALGGLGNQNWRQLTRRAYAMLFNVEDMVLRDEVLLLTAECLLNLVITLEEHGHVATGKVALRSDSTQALNENLRSLLKKLQAACGHNQWENAYCQAGFDYLQRAWLVADIRTAPGQLVNGMHQA